MSRFSTIAAILANKYDVGPMAARSETVLWAADEAVDIVGADQAKAELKAINARRHKMGKTIAYPVYGSRVSSAR